jgi:mRNA-degrading endonuclease RelE of RelBE toxin-antitoxin system
VIKKIIISKSLRKKIRKLPVEVREKFYWSIDMLIKNERHPSLRHKKIEGARTYWEFSITMNYRAVYRQEGDKGFLSAVGKHEDVF